MRNKVHRLSTAVIATVLAASLVLAACGSSDATGEKSASHAATVASPSVAPPSPAPSSAASSAESPAASPVAPSASASALATSAQAAPTPSFQSSGKPSNVTFTKLAVGQKPPQFIIFSFDGAGSHEKWQRFMQIAAKHDARFTGFLTGIYLLEDAKKKAYTGPGHAPGKASVSFGGTREDVANLVNDLNQAWAAGHEIGTHYNGHFCSGTKHPGSAWSAAEWGSEIAQFKKFFTEYKQLNGYGEDFPTLQVPVTSVKGGRTQCLEGEWGQLVPAWKEAGFTYDTSKQLGAGLTWPVKKDGIWEFQMPYVYSPAFAGAGYKSPNVMAMDYNFWVKINGGKNEPSRAADMTAKVKQTYDFMYDQAYKHNRAPLVIGNHFNNWSGNAFNPAIEQFMAEKCGAPETICATYQDVIHWMETQDQPVLAALQAKPAVATGP